MQIDPGVTCKFNEYISWILFRLGWSVDLQKVVSEHKAYEYSASAKLPIMGPL